VPQAARLFGEIPVIQFGMAAALVDDLNIREAHPHAVNAHEQLVIARFWDVEQLRFTITSYIFHARAVQIPRPCLFGHRRVSRAILLIFRHLFTIFDKRRSARRLSGFVRMLETVVAGHP